jgi:hypothetical protein
VNLFDLVQKFLAIYIHIYDLPQQELHIVKDVGMRNEASPESVRPIVRLVMVCLLGAEKTEEYRRGTCSNQI